MMNEMSDVACSRFREMVHQTPGFVSYLNRTPEQFECSILEVDPLEESLGMIFRVCVQYLGFLPGRKLLYAAAWLGLEPRFNIRLIKENLPPSSHVQRMAVLSIHIDLIEMVFAKVPSG